MRLNTCVFAFFHAKWTRSVQSGHAVCKVDTQCAKRTCSVQSRHAVCKVDTQCVLADGGVVQEHRKLAPFDYSPPLTAVHL